ncbi:MAG: ABC transporter substrate-binding protein [Myxococcaceae bacterium]
MKTGTTLGFKYVVAALVACAACGPSQVEGPKEPIHLRGIFAITGPVADQTAPLNAGLLDSIRDANDNGGILGHPIEIQYEDFQYVPQNALDLYNKYKADTEAWAKVSTIFGTGTADTLKLGPELVKDSKAFMTFSYAGSLASPSPVKKTITLPDNSTVAIDTPGFPYVFFAGTDYSTMVRVGLEFVKKQGGRKVAFAYCSVGVCTEPIPAGKLHAAALNLQVTADIRPELTETQEQINAKVSAFFANNPDTDWVWIANTRVTAVRTAKAVKQFGPPGVKMIVNTNAFDEAVFGECSNDCVSNYFGVLPVAAYGDLRYPGMDAVVALHDRIRAADGQPTTLHANLQYLKGYLTFFIWRKAVEQVLQAGQELTGPNIKAAFETFSGLDTGGVSPPLTFTPTDHRPMSRGRIYSINSFGKFQYEDEPTVELKPEWLGW